jgi:ATP-dependent helicase HrpB
VVVAPPGAGKTTRVPPALVDAGPVILLQPRRLAARALAARIAAEQGWTLGEEVGWQVRFERRSGPRTRLLVATEGILTARLRGDPLLADFSTIVLDEFHERSLHADLALALAREAWRARHDLRLVVMSATLDAAPVSAYLDGCPVVEVAGRPHPVAIAYAPDLSPAAAIRAALAREPGGHVLCFLPGAPEIARLVEELGRGPELPGAPLVLPLHGSLTAAEQDRALAPAARRKVILATNLAETSLTVEGVREVVDTGLHKVLRFDPERGLDRLATERIARDSAEQRAGRAGRTGPGRVVRLWDPRLELRPRREPEILRVDLASPFLEVLAWGGDPRRFSWFEPPPEEGARAAIELLEALGAARAGRVTALGRRLARLPLHPRLSRVLVETRGSREAAAACAALAEGWRPSDPSGEPPTTACDLLLAADRLAEAPSWVRRAAAELERLASADERHARAGAGGDEAESGRRAAREESLRRALLAAYPDRVARRRAAGSPRLLLASGQGAVLGKESGVREAEFLVALDVAGAGRGATAAQWARVRAASAIEREWLAPTRVENVHWLDPSTRQVRAAERSYYGEIPLAEAGRAPDPERAAELLAAALAEAPPSPAATAVAARLAFAGLADDAPALLDAARRAHCRGRTSLPQAFDPAPHLPPDLRRRLDTLAPATLDLPSGRKTRLEYRPDGTVLAEAKLQELFGLTSTPRLGPRGEPVTFVLLAPNGRPVQTTRDLESFWRRGYPEVRKALRGRYPKHPWPEDPWTAMPTYRAQRRAKRR